MLRILAPLFFIPERPAFSRKAPPASPQNFTRIDRLIRFSLFFRSGVKPGTNAPGDPQIFSTIGALGQEGVTPPGPEKYGTFAARRSNSQRKVMYWLGM
jgi:hypothetical protein